MNINKPKTDREQSITAAEYLWDTVADTEVHRYVEPVLFEWLKNSQGTRLLDLGCGNGALTSKLTKFGVLCTGTDFSDSGITIAKSTFKDVDFFQSFIEHPLPLLHWDNYDLVVAVEVIEHLLLPRQLFDRAIEALKPEGTFILTTPFHGYWKNLALALFNKYDSHWHPLRDYGHVKFFSVKTIEDLFKEQGFLVEEIRFVGRIPAFSRSMMIKGKKII